VVTSYKAQGTTVNALEADVRESLFMKQSGIQRLLCFPVRTMKPEAPHAQLVGDLLVFASVVEHGSFTAASAAVGVAKSQVTKQVRRLEARLGATLLHRTTRRMALTQAGESVHEHALALARSAGAALDAAAQHGQRPTGRLRVSASVTYGQHVLSPLLPGFIRRYPGVEVELLLIDRYVDLLEEGLDLTVRFTAKPPPSLAGRPLHDVAFVVCGTPRFVKPHLVSSPQDLKGIPCMSFSAQARRNGSTWQFQRGRERVGVDVGGPVVANSSDVVRELVIGDLGLGLLPEFVVKHDLAAKSLVRVLPDWHASGTFGPTAWVLWQPQRAMPPKMRVFVDYLVEHLAEGVPSP
jgi:DNA-binding transcriptional LysR family regulator